MSFAAQALPLPAPLPAPALDEWVARRPSFPPLDAGLAAALAPCAISPAAQSNLAALAQGKAGAIVAGQQPCFPFPLGLTLQKAATAVALAQRLSAAGHPSVPLFWCAADDSDFEEARGQLLLRCRRPPLRLRLPEQARRPGGFVGDMDIGPAWRELLGLLPRALAESSLAPRSGEDLGARECRLLAERFAKAGLLVLDARSPALRLAAAPLFARYAARREAFAACVDAAGDALAARGGDRPLRAGIGRRALYFLRSRRRSLPAEEEYGGALADRLAADPASLAPNAALRPLVQDYLLPVQAAVLGPAEWRYHAQLAPAFPVLDLELPPALPRLALDWPAGPAPASDDASRHASPLGLTGHPLADPALLLEAAARHLEHWTAGRWVRLAYEGERACAC